MRWIELKEIDNDQRIIYLPKEITEKLNSKVTLRFGLRELEVKVKAVEQEKRRVTFNAPLLVECSKSVIEELLIQVHGIYQIKTSKKSIEIGPVIGLLLGDQYYYYHDRFMQEYTDALQCYKKTGGLFFAFKAKSIDWSTKTIYGLYFDYHKQKWDYGKFPFPTVIYRRGYHAMGKVLKKLYKLTNNKVFNGTRYDKWQLNSKLEESNLLNPYLPETIKLENLEKLNNLLDKYNGVILKPVALSRGRGICIIRKLNDDNLIINNFSYRNSDKNLKQIIKRKDLADFIAKGKFLERKYIAQQYLKLAKINGAPFDIRIVMQKSPDKKWNCTGIECRLAGENQTLTNISLGGKALTLETAVNLAFGPKMDHIKAHEEILRICHDFCNFMDETKKLYGEFGIDIAIDEDGQYWFIEANVRPTFKGFKDMDYDTYLKICTTPIIFAASLAGFGKKEVAHD